MLLSYQGGLMHSRCMSGSGILLTTVTHHLLYWFHWVWTYVSQMIKGENVRKWSDRQWNIRKVCHIFKNELIINGWYFQLWKAWLCATIGGTTLHIWLRPQIEQCHTLNRGARPHIEANVSSCANHPTLPILIGAESIWRPPPPSTSTMTFCVVPG
jgi:hypothetical protein